MIGCNDHQLASYGMGEIPGVALELFASFTSVTTFPESRIATGQK